MSYLVLARKYRPATFSEVVGKNTSAHARDAFATVGFTTHLVLRPRGCAKTTSPGSSKGAQLRESHDRVAQRRSVRPVQRLYHDQ